MKQLNNDMKKLLLSLGLISTIFVSCITGCTTAGSTSFQTVAGKFLTSTAITVDATMTGAAKLEVSGVITQTDWQKLSLYYNQYVSNMILATNAYNLAVLASDPSLFAAPSNNLFASKSLLTSSVTTVSTNK
jgi:hypothetical protein